jgi:hypothetical protein
MDRFRPYLRKVSIEIVIGEFTQNGAKAVQPVQPPTCGRQNDVS